ncbi:MAG: Rieske 2Fe-2S domain-containing protein, partial [Alphaproteobacteria bacterium]|nr:Rieske 2Fe-2S domain-containing protein [Alphaproteobacteria bacterium]
RDDHDRLGLIGLHCPHRGTDLSYGRVEDGGLRCLYHGWLFDIHGTCLEQPAEIHGKSFCERVKHTAYPVEEKGGVIWTYMGEGAPPLIPDFQFLMAPEPNRLAFRVKQLSNWLQGVESSTDPAHTTFLHRRPPGIRSERSGTDVNAVRGTEPPKIATENTSFGTRIYALHNSPNGRKYLRVNNYVYPSGTTASQSGDDVSYQGRIYVPIDDHSHYRFEFFYSHDKPMDKDRLRKNREKNVAPDHRHVRRAENRYLQDRESMKSEGSWSGMGLHFPSQDAFAIETQGAIQDRTKEMLGSSDIVITAVRRTLLNAIKDIEEGKPAPGQIRDPSQGFYDDFICTAVHIGDDEDGPSFCRRVLAERKKTAAAE